MQTMTPSAPPPRSARTPGWRVRERAIGVAMMLPQAVPFLTFTVAPLVWVIYLSFTDYDGFSQAQWVGLQNYRDLLDDSAWWHSVIVTGQFAVLKVVIEIPISLGLAVLLNRKLRLGGLFRTIFFLPHVISVAILGIIFYFLLRPDNGIINGLLQSTGLLDQDVDWLGRPWSALGSVVVVGVWSGFGLNTVLFLVGLQNIPKELLESASIDGASGWQRFRSIIVPLLAPMTRVIVILTIVFTLRSFDLIKTLTDGGPGGSTDVMFTYMFGYYFSSDRGSQIGYASALSVTASALIAIVSVLYLLSGRRGAGRTAARR